MKFPLHPIILATLFSIAAINFTSCGTSNPTEKTTNTHTCKIVYRPLVTIRNNSYKLIILGLQGPETRLVSIPARSSRSINLISGSYKYDAKAQNAKTTSGYKYFSSNRKYQWTFPTH